MQRLLGVLAAVPAGMRIVAIRIVVVRGVGIHSIQYHIERWHLTLTSRSRVRVKASFGVSPLRTTRRTPATCTDKMTASVANDVVAGNASVGGGGRRAVALVGLLRGLNRLCAAGRRDQGAQQRAGEQANTRGTQSGCCIGYRRPLVSIIQTARRSQSVI